MIHWHDLEIEVSDDSLAVDGVTLPINAIPEILYALAHPDPRKWYSFERAGEHVIVHVKIQEVSDAYKIESER